MKTARWLLLVVGIIAITMTIGCRKLGDDRVNVAFTEASPLVEPIWAGQTILVGHVYLWEDASDNLYIKYSMDVTDNGQWYLTECQAHIALTLDGLPHSPGGLVPGQFDYKSGDLDDLTEYTFACANIGDWETGLTVYVATHCVVWKDIGGGGRQTETGWGDDLEYPGSNWSRYFTYTFGEENPGGEWHVETSWAGNASNWRLWQFSGKNWAVYLKYENTDLAGAMYVGNPKNGAHTAGTVTVSRDTIDGYEYLSVTYDADADWDLYECHVHVAQTLAGIPQKKGNPPPGQFAFNSGCFDPYEDSYTVLVPWDPNWVPPLYVAAHSIVGTYNWPLW